MIKLSLKRLQPNWPADELISSRLSSIRSSNSPNWPAPTKTILKEVWLKSVPIRNPKTYDPGFGMYLITPIEMLVGFNLMEYLKRDNPSLELNRNNALAILHVAFNIVSLLREGTTQRRIIFDYIKCSDTYESVSNGIHVKKIFSTDSLLILSEAKVTELFDMLVNNNYYLLWSTINDLINSAIETHRGLFDSQILFSTRWKHFPAKRSGFCPNNLRVEEPLRDIPWRTPHIWTASVDISNQVSLNSNHEWAFVDSLQSIQEQRVSRPEPRRAVPVLNEKLQECIRILNEVEISKEVRLSVYELILANDQ